ncbi:MAG: hypothetical protein ABSF75_02960 [Terracidiphilus sp.]|jgi:hypothetical protein
MPQKSFVDPMRRLLTILSLFVPIAGAMLVHAQGGPPFIGDDPGTPGNHHWEINFGWIANHNPGQSYYEIPDVDINYGWGDRIQLKYELPLAAATDPNNSTGVGLGESYPGIKWRYFEYHRAGQPKTDENLLFSLGTYPQVMINNPTSSVRRGIVQPGPQYYLPIEATAQVGWLALNGEVGRWIGNRNAPDQWGRGLIAGHEFNDRTELYAELYDLQAINRPPGQQIDSQPKQRSFTIDLGGRQTVGHSGHLRLLFMGGRAIQAVTRTNGEPSWIAYIGLQLLFGPKEKETPVAEP